MGDPTRNFIIPPRPDPGMEYAAAVAICAHATDKTDALRLLEMCGLLGQLRGAR